MKRHLLLFAAALSLLFVPSAKADDFTLSFSGTGISGSISFVATATASGAYRLDEMIDPSGYVTFAVPDQFTVIGFSNFEDPARKFNYPANGKGRYLNLSGLSFQLEDGSGTKDQINIFQYVEGGDVISGAIVRRASANPYLLDTLSIAPTPTPEPGGLVLMGTSALLGAGEMLRRRRSAA